MRITNRLSVISSRAELEAAVEATLFSGLLCLDSRSTLLARLRR